jgi:hypothetical protein
LGCSANAERLKTAHAAKEVRLKLLFFLFICLPLYRC